MYCNLVTVKTKTQNAPMVKHFLHGISEVSPKVENKILRLEGKT